MRVGLLSARAIFQAADQPELLYNIPTTEPVPLSDAAANDIPQSLVSVVMACLSKNPDDRPATIDELAAASKVRSDRGSVGRGRRRALVGEQNTV